MQLKNDTSSSLKFLHTVFLVLWAYSSRVKGQANCVDMADCNYNGHCDRDTCVCFYGFGGKYCQYWCILGECGEVTTRQSATDQLSTYGCNGHGNYEYYRCRCDFGYYGDHCERSRLLEDTKASARIKKISLIVIYSTVGFMAILSVCLVTRIAGGEWNCDCYCCDHSTELPWWQQQSQLNRRDVTGMCRPTLQHAIRETVRNDDELTDDDGGFPSSDHSQLASTNQSNHPTRIVPSAQTALDLPPSYTEATEQQHLPLTEMRTMETVEGSVEPQSLNERYQSRTPSGNDIPPPAYETVVLPQGAISSELGQVVVDEPSELDTDPETLDGYRDVEPGQSRPAPLSLIEEDTSLAERQEIFL